MHTTEQRLLALAAAGFHGTVTISVSEERVQFTGQLSRYQGFQNEVKALAHGNDAAGAAALGRMLRAAEAYVDDGERIELLPVHLPSSSADVLRTAHRRENADVAQALDQQAVRELEPHL